MAKTLPITLDNEINDVITKSKEFIMPEPTLIVHTENDDMTITHFNAIQIERNFTENLSDVIFLEFFMGLGTATKVLYKHRDALEATLKLKFENNKIVKRRYKIILLTKFENIYDSSMTKAKQEELDTQEIVNIKVQCIDETLLKLKKEYISGVFHDYDLKTLLKGLFSKRMKELNTDSYINIYDPDNTQVYDNIVIDPFTKFIKLPFIFQNGMYGLYDNGANIYFSNISEASTIKYDVDIYPIWDYERFAKESNRPKLVLINPTIENMNKHEFNFYYKDGIYKTLVSNVEFKLDSEDKRYDAGNGLIMEYSNNTINQDFLTITDDQITYMDEAAYNFNKIDSTRSFTNYRETLGDDNLYKYFSMLNRHQGVIGTITLPKVNPEIIYPGMPFKYLFNNDGKVSSTTGIIQGLNYVYDFLNKTTVVMLVGIFKRIPKEK